MPSEAEIRAALVAEARQWIGTPYTPYGRVKGKAADCIFHEVVGRDVLGFKHRYGNYPLLPRGREIEARADRDLILQASAEAGPIPFEALKPGRLALFVGNNPNEPQHFGMIADHPKFPGAKTLIHAMGREGGGGRVIEATFATAAEWGQRGAVRSVTRRLWKVYEFPGVEVSAING